MRNFPPRCELTSTETSRRARADPGSPSVRITVSLGSSATQVGDKVSVDAKLEAKVEVRVNVEVEAKVEIKIEDSHDIVNDLTVIAWIDASELQMHKRIDAMGINDRSTNVSEFHTTTYRRSSAKFDL